RVAVAFLLFCRLRFVFLEAVATQLRAERETRDIGGSDSGLYRLEIDVGRGPFPARELASDRAPEIEPVLVTEGGGLPEAHYHDARILDALRREHVDRRALLALEAGDLRRLGE